MVFVRWFLTCSLSLALLVTGQVAWAAPVGPVAVPATPGSETADNDTPATATPIVSGERVRADVFPAADVDYYAFQAQAGQRVYAAVTTVGSATSSDSVLTLVEPDGSTVVETDDNDGSHTVAASSLAGVPLTAGGTYYLRVGGKSAAVQIRPYDLYLQLRSGAVPAETEPNDLPATAQPLVGEVTGVHQGAADGDYYSFTLARGDTVLLSLDLDPERDVTTWSGRLGLGLLGDADDQVLTVDDAGTGDTIDSESLALTVDRAGTYYAVVDGPSDVGAVTATYRLSASVLGAREASCRTYTAAPADGTIADLAATTFQIPVTDTMRVGEISVDLDLTHPFMQDLDVTLTAPGGSRVTLFSDVGSTTSGAQTHFQSRLTQDAAQPVGIGGIVRPLQFRPEGTDLGWFHGIESAGDWTLTVYDDTTTDQGDLEAVSLNLCPQIEPAQSQTVFAADFETGDDGFTHAGTADEWERGTPAKVAAGDAAGLTTCGSGADCFATDLEGTYDASSSQDLVSPPIDLTGRTGTVLATWQQWYQLESASFDHAVVSVETEGGGVSQPLWTWRGPTMALLLGNPSVTTPQVAGWGRQVADISDFAGEVVRLRFHLDADSSVQHAGLGIDDVRVIQPRRSVSVTRTGTGEGSVSSSPSGLACGPTCSALFVEGSTLTLTATPAAGSTFTGFTGCTNTGALTCTVTVDGAMPVSAHFDLVEPTVTPTPTPTPNPTPSATPTLKAKPGRKGAVKLTVRCGSTACTVKVRKGIVTSKGEKLGKLTVPKPLSVGAGKTARLKLKASATLKSKTAEAKKPKAKVKVLFTYPDGRTVKLTTTVRVR